MKITRISLEPPYLIYLGDVPDLHHAKTGAGVAYWRPESCVGQMRLPDCPIDLELPEMSVQDAKDAGVKTVIVGVAPKGGQIPENWIPQLVELAGADCRRLAHEAFRHSRFGCRCQRKRCQTDRRADATCKTACS